MNTTIEQLQQELYSTLKKAERNRRILNISRILCYGGGLIYFIGIIVMQFAVFSGKDSLFVNDYELNPNPTFFEQNKIIVFIIPLFAVILFGTLLFGFFFKKFTEAEQNAVRRIIRTMFPDAKLALLPSNVSKSQLLQSNFFGGMNSQYSEGQSFGTIIFEKDGRKITFRDIVINIGQQDGWLSQSSVFGLFVVFKMLFKGVFGARAENIASNFRGMFVNAQLEKKINGSVVVVPDHLESRLDYPAKNIQALKNINGNKLVTLEDVEFERYFAVYANDEITARYVLTPAMMLRMTELKKKYDRDIMLSFNGGEFYFAVAMPEGFLTLGNASLTSGEALKDLYDNIVTAQGILNDLKLK